MVQIFSLRGTDFLLLWYRFSPSVGQIFFFHGTDFLLQWNRFLLLRDRFPSSVGQIPSFRGTFCENLILAPFGIRCARKLGAAYAILRVG